MQTRKGSWLEALAGTAVGYLINFTANLTVLPLFGYNITVRDNLGIGVIYTVISLVRTYCLRRTFNYWHVRRAQ